MKPTRSFAAAPLIIALLALLFVGSTFFVPLPSDVVNPTAAHWRAAASTAPAVLLVGSGYIFLRGLSSFKDGRSAYRLFAIAMLVFSLLLVQVTIWGLFDMWDTAWATSGAGLLPLAVTAVFIYLSSRAFAALLDSKSILRNSLFATLVSVAAGIAMSMLAGRVVAYDIPGTELYIGVCALGAAFMTFATLLMYKVSRSIGASYQRAMAWLTASLAAFSIASWHESISTLWFNNGSTYTDYGYYLLPWTVAGLLTLFASYRFREITRLATGHVGASHPPTDEDYVNSILAIAALASKPENIDQMLDGLREVTAVKRPGESFTDAEKQQLLETYHHLEVYLMHDEPLRTITREELLGRVTPAFRQILERKADSYESATVSQY
ncbi:MAG TPA: hypothetical protein VD735_07280 [Candidatus Saccharimonadales bacterium]|nr:hypothetical protein [Candidatus Saccharimonadales bacterium]